MPPVKQYILVEGVNVLDNLYDTDQLSIIRGSSALYKSAITAIALEFSATLNNPLGHLQAITTGASSGLFLVSQGNVSELVASIRHLLDKGVGDFKNFTYLTFQVMSCEAENLKEARNKLATQLRIAQLQDFTQKPDRQGQADDQLGKAVCGLEGRRIVSSGRKSKVQSETRQLSASVYARLNYGRQLRQQFYQEALAGHDEVLARLSAQSDAVPSEPRYRFAGDFIELCQDVEQQHANLANKMAVVYIDGNKFGDRQQDFIDHQCKHKQGATDISAQQDFDKAIQEKRAKYLASEITIQLDAHTKGGVIPLETLMWGGDEMLLVMPAWQGFGFLQRFFAADWQLGETGVLEPLTHAAGVVFCQANTPIRIIQGLAHDLSERVKNADNGREQNGWDYLVLESIDYPTSSNLDNYFKAHYGEVLAGHRAHLPAVSGWPLDFARQFSEKMTKRQLYHVVNAVMKPQATAMPSWLAITTMSKEEGMTHGPQIEAEQRLCRLSSDNKHWLQQTLPALAKSLFAINDMDNPQQRAWLWLHLVELWDYLVPVSVTDAAEKEVA